MKPFYGSQRTVKFWKLPMRHSLRSERHPVLIDARIVQSCCMNRPGCSVLSCNGATLCRCVATGNALRSWTCTVDMCASVTGKSSDCWLPTSDRGALNVAMVGITSAWADSIATQLLQTAGIRSIGCTRTWAVWRRYPCRQSVCPDVTPPSMWLSVAAGCVAPDSCWSWNDSRRAGEWSARNWTGSVDSPTVTPARGLALIEKQPKLRKIPGRQTARPGAKERLTASLARSSRRPSRGDRRHRRRRGRWYG